LNAALSEYRLTAWRNSIEMIRDKPVQGFGLGNFKIIYPAYSHWAVVDRVLDKTHYLGKAHNDYIQIAAELGIPGFLLFVLVPAYGLVLSWRLLREPRTCSFYPVIVGVAGGLIAFMVSAFFSFPMQRSLPPLLVFFYCGILAILNGDPAGQNKKMIIKLPRPIGLSLVFLIGFSGVALLRFNLRNINCDKYYFEAIGMEKSGVDRKALSASLNAHQYNKHRMDVLTTMGRAYIATGELDRATETLEKVISKTPNNLNALFFLGVAYTNSDRNVKAIEIFKKVLHLNPDFYLARQIICSLKAFGKARVSLS
jgi:tetratricopeptide (TPR) repeat protein